MMTQSGFISLALVLCSLWAGLQAFESFRQLEGILEITSLDRPIPKSPTVFVTQIPFFDYIPSRRNPSASRILKNYNNSTFIARLVPNLRIDHSMSDDHYGNSTHHLIRKRQGTSCCSCGCCIQQTCCPTSWCGGSCGGSSSGYGGYGGYGGCGSSCGCQSSGGCGCQSSSGCGCQSSSGCGCQSTSGCGCQSTSGCGCGGSTSGCGGCGQQSSCGCSSGGCGGYSGYSGSSGCGGCWSACCCQTSCCSCGGGSYGYGGWGMKLRKRNFDDSQLTSNSTRQGDQLRIFLQGDQ